MIISYLKSLLRDELADILPDVKKKVDAKYLSFQPDKIYSFGDKNQDKTFCIINRKMPGAGMFSNVTFVMNQIKKCLKNNLIPVVDMKNFPGIYNELNSIDGKMNSWEYYFDQPSKYSLEDVYKSKNVIFSENVFKIDSAENKNYVLDLNSNDLISIKQYLKPNKKYHDEANNFFDTSFRSNDKILGVHFRGTTYKICARHAFCLTPKMMIKNINFLMKKYGYNKIFLCTEEIPFLKKLKDYYNEKLFYLDIYRVKINPFSSHIPAYKNYPRENHRYLLGKESLLEALVMARCHGLTYVKTNVVSAAQLFSEIKQHDHPLNIGYNSKNRFLSRWMWYLKNLLPNKLGGFKNIKYE